MLGGGRPVEVPYTDRGQLSDFAVLQKADQGGELILHEVRSDEMDHQGRLRGAPVGLVAASRPSTRGVLEAGDLIVFDAGRVHQRVSEVGPGPRRVTISGFVAPPPQARPGPLLELSDGHPGARGHNRWLGPRGWMDAQEWPRRVPKRGRRAVDRIPRNRGRVPTSVLPPRRHLRLRQPRRTSRPTSPGALRGARGASNSRPPTPPTSTPSSGPGPSSQRPSRQSKRAPPAPSTMESQPRSIPSARTERPGLGWALWVARRTRPLSAAVRTRWLPQSSSLLRGGARWTTTPGTRRCPEATRSAARRVECAPAAAPLRHSGPR